jgi:hypothetical protein
MTVRICKFMALMAIICCIQGQHVMMAHTSEGSSSRFTPARTLLQTLLAFFGGSAGKAPVLGMLTRSS